jgi:RNA polymerase sigma-32 factor
MEQHAMIPHAESGELPAITSNLDAYLARIRQLPLLSAEEEYTLAKRWRDDGDVSAAHRLVISNLRFVVQVARGYAGYGLALPDLIQEGNIGLMKAVKRYDPDQGVRLLSWAVHWIRAEIQEFILRNWRLLRIATTKAQRKLFFNLRSHKEQLGALNSQEAATIAEELGVSTKDVLEMDTRLQGQEVPLLSSSEEQDGTTLSQEQLAAEDADPAETYALEEWRCKLREAIGTALAALDERSRGIVVARWGEPPVPLRVLAERYGISIERVRQLENQARKSLRRALEPMLANQLTSKTALQQGEAPRPSSLRACMASLDFS